ncbi:hypothetical protein [Pseudarthrobacter sp. NIBRBAC000502770]|uniref:hypothetical protein n=1 Tax=Pseudarthrobacter sp. NIBRBAC000502770 TaxID=2590785 RepID=UPI00113FEF1D|nr:hypothetical protein [Pseudarthrobacter sp. NIBRBAC000502770]QDG90678.1 hypothetical protein NIBR502770_20870 [Pseudarthrobacter sp. NIBRBAC000502770]
MTINSGTQKAGPQRHIAVAFERGTYGHDGSQNGFAARCETCGAVTFGGFRTKTDAKAALEHKAVGS